METPKIERAQQILDIIEPIPAEKFIVGEYGDDKGNSCFLGHIHRKLHPEGNFRGDYDGYGARTLTEKFLRNEHDLHGYDGADVNNEPTVNGYTEPVIKDRVVHMLKDMVEAGY